MTIFSTKFESWCKFFSPIKLVSLRKLAPSHNAVFNHQTGMDFVTEISFCKTPIVDEKRLVFRGWELESQLGKSFKVSGQTFIRHRTHSHDLWSLLVIIIITQHRALVLAFPIHTPWYSVKRGPFLHIALPLFTDRSLYLQILFHRSSRFRK